MKLLGTGTDAKTVKGEKYGYMTGILYLAPYKESGVANVCPNASAGCIASCLYTAGRGAMSNVQRARIAKTVLFKTDNAMSITLSGQYDLSRAMPALIVAPIISFSPP